MHKTNSYLWYSMKWLSYILTFVVVVLAIQPTLALVSEKPVSEYCGSSCCYDVQDAPKDTENKSGDFKDQNCNPFQSCGCCLGFTVKSGFFGMQPPMINKSTLVSCIENSSSQFTPDFWQPPKID